VFIAAGMRPTFIEELNGAIDDLSATLAARVQRRAAQAGATRGLDEVLKRCFRYKAVLDSFIETEARDDLPLLAWWRNVKRVESLPGRRRKQPSASEPSMLQPGTSSQPIRDAARLLAAPTSERSPIPRSLETMAG
jgi:hypothetical protein